MKTENEVVYLSFDDAETLVNRIAERAEQFHHVMSKEEKQSMAQLLSDIGVQVSDLVDVSRLADEYAINAQIVGPDEVENYSHTDLQDALFSWKEDGETHYCLTW